MEQDVRRDRLREAVLDELALVQGRIALASHLGDAEAKEQLRLAHSSQREARLADAAEFLAAREDVLIREFADGADVDPRAIDPVVIPVRTPAEADLFRFATLQWSVPVSSGYGRRSRFLVRDRQNGKLIAIFALGDPVIAQSARDATIGWTTKQRNDRLYNVYDAFVLGAVEPYRQLLAGKLVALLTLANETRDFLTRKYAGNTTEIRGEAKDPTPALITTSSALGRSSIYNRITFHGSLMFQSVGYTKGYGHFQFSDGLFSQLLDHVREQTGQDPTDSGHGHSSQYGKGPNWRFRVLRMALESLDIPKESLQHNVKREVFLAPLARNWDRYLRGEDDKLDEFDLPTEHIAEYYRDRWAVGRAERRPAFRYWRHEEARITPLLRNHPVQMTLGRRPLHGQVEIGDFHLSVGVGKVSAGAESEGIAYLSRFEGPTAEVTIADVSRPDGTREVRGWAVRGTGAGLESIVGQLAIAVEPAQRYRDMSTMELRPLTRSETGRVGARKTTLSELSARLGFDVSHALDKLGDASIGTRAALLKDTGPRRNQLCVVFRSDDVTVPALVWVLARAFPLVLDGAASSSRVTLPDLRRTAPKPAELETDHDAATA